jgi:hypothetical protein
MEYSKIVAITGLPGLFELINSKTDGAIVKSLEDNSTRFVSSRVHNFSHLESIEVYTVRDNVNLVDVFHAMEKAGGKLPDEKDAAAVKKYFETAFPELDFDRVYSSDMKKMVRWFSVLQQNNIEIKLSEPEEIAEEEAAPVAEEKAPEEKPAKKTAKKKADADDTATEEKPTKKPAAKATKAAEPKK